MARYEREGRFSAGFFFKIKQLSGKDSGESNNLVYFYLLSCLSAHIYIHTHLCVRYSIAAVQLLMHVP